MKHETYLKPMLSGLILMVSIMLVACTDELVDDGRSAYDAFDESDITDVMLAVSVNNFAVSMYGGTRAEEPTEGAEEEMSDFEKQVDNIWVFQYDENDNLLIRPRYYTALTGNNDGTWSVSAVLKPNITSKIYAVTNVNSTTWASDSDSFMTVSELMASTLPEPYTIYDLSDDAVEGHIPMQGHVEGVMPGNGVTITVPVERMYAKVKVRVIIDRLLEPYDPSINSVYAQNCPWYCRIGTLYDGTAESQDKMYGQAADYWLTRSMIVDGEGNNTDDPNNTPLEEAGEEPYDYVIYIPENIQGEVEVDDRNADAKADNLPSSGHPTSIVVELRYTNSSGAESEAHYEVYPGGNNYNNFNIRRNQVYRVSMTLGSPDTEHTPSANSIVAHPGKTISFEPYYRVETGGGYDFLDYISPNSDDGTGEQIRGIKILWQTEDCIGDNTNGDLVYFVASEPQDLHDKIYVTANAPGNAVIAAYNDDPDTNPNAEIIWSWHIWVTNEDPTNISNAVTYYTYQWDSDGIYGEGSGKSRVPGYGMMSCNLGALSSEPSDESDMSVFGMNYQWGRKDPFPSLIARATGITSSAQPYTEETVGPLYDNSNEGEVGMTATAVTSENELFHSLPGSEIQSMTGSVAYTIKNPTVFMCGTLEAGATGSTGESYVQSRSNYFNSGSWLPEGEDTYDLWGGTDPTEATMSYTVNESSGVHLYDDYGEKSIFDPCPYGWRVSPPDQWLGFSIDGKNPSSYSEINTPSTTEGGNMGYGMYLYVQAWKTGLTSYFPTPGPRVANGCGIRNWSCGNYHNATVDLNDRVNILHIHDQTTNFRIFETGNYMYYVKSVAGPVRCVRDAK